MRTAAAAAAELSTGWHSALPSVPTALNTPLQCVCVCVCVREREHTPETAEKSKAT